MMEKTGVTQKVSTKNLTTSQLEMLGFAVFTASNGEEGVEKAS